MITRIQIIVPKEALFRLLSIDGLPQSDGTEVASFAAEVIDATEGAEKATQFLRSLPASVAGNLLLQRASTGERGELTSEILPIKRVLTSIVDLLNSQTPNLNFRYLPKGFNLLATGAKDRLCEIYRELFELIGRDLICSNPIGANAFKNAIKLGDYDCLLHEKIDEITAWAQRHQINIT